MHRLVKRISSIVPDANLLTSDQAKVGQSKTPKKNSGIGALSDRDQEKAIDKAIEVLTGNPHFTNEEVAAEVAKEKKFANFLPVHLSRLGKDGCQSDRFKEAKKEIKQKYHAEQKRAKSNAETPDEIAAKEEEESRKKKALENFCLQEGIPFEPTDERDKIIQERASADPEFRERLSDAMYGEKESPPRERTNRRFDTLKASEQW